MTSRHIRIVMFSLFVSACVLGGAAYVQQRRQNMTAGPTATADPPSGAEKGPTIDELRTVPHLLFLSRRTDAVDRLQMAGLDLLGSSQFVGTVECERSHFGERVGLCLAVNRESIEPRAFALVLDRRFQVQARLPLAGLPIRARVSPDQRYGVATVFVTGESYASDFTTRTTVIDLAQNRPIADLEEFTVEQEGRAFRKVDFNFWGVTFFQDGNRFFATLGTGGQRLLVEGDIGRRHMRVVGSDVECPSLSPDERHLVFKRRTAGATGWQLWALELASKREWPITAADQDVDDQAEWLDNTRVVYGLLFGQGPPEATLSLWVSDVSPESGLDQQLFLRSASSPSVVR